MQNLKCSILPLGSSSDAILLEAMAITIWPSKHNVEVKALHKKVFPIPP